MNDFATQQLFRVFMNIYIFFKTALQNRKFGPVFSSTSFLKFCIQFYFILYLSLM